MAVEAKENVFPESIAVSSSSPALFSGMAAAAASLTSAAEGLEGVSALES